MKKRSKKNSNSVLKIAVIIGIILGVLIGFSIVYFVKVGKIQETYFNDKDLGIIKLSFSKKNIFSSIRQATFQVTEAKVGDKVEIYENVYFTESKCDIEGWITDIKQQIYRDGSLIATISLIDKELNPGATYCGDFTRYTSFTPTREGTYTIKTVYTRETGKSGTIMGSRELKVTESYSPPVCNKNAFWDSWAKYKTISNGQIDARVHWSVSSNCDFYRDGQIEYRTICNNGFIVEGTSNTIASGKKSCIKGETTIDECNTGVTASCSDGSIITIKSCVNGKLQDTSEICPTQEEVDETSGYVIKDTECVLVTADAKYSTIEQCVANLDLTEEEREELIKKSGETSGEKEIKWWEEYKYYIIGGIIGFLLIIIIIILIIKRRPTYPTRR